MMIMMVTTMLSRKIGTEPTGQFRGRTSPQSNSGSFAPRYRDEPEGILPIEHPSDDDTAI
jgi:hypothetical protein